MSIDPTEKSLKAWEAMRAGGKWKFIFLKGVLYWGGSMFVVMGLAFPALMHPANAFSPRLLIVNALVWPIGGFLWGALVWFLLERKFAKLQRIRENSAQ